jgi:hypothetical protein
VIYDGSFLLASKSQHGLHMMISTLTKIFRDLMSEDIVFEPREPIDIRIMDRIDDIRPQIRSRTQKMLKISIDGLLRRIEFSNFNCMDDRRSISSFLLMESGSCCGS